MLTLLNEVNFPLDKLLKAHLESLGCDYLKDIDGYCLSAVLQVLGYESIDAGLIPDNNGQWKIGYRCLKTDKQWICYSDEKEPFTLMREIYIKVIDWHFINEVTNG